LEDTFAIDIIVKNKILYLGIDNNGLSIINATDYLNPFFLTRYNDTISSYHGFDIKNNYLYSANYYYSLDIFNIENVSNLQLINSHQTKTDNSDIYVVNNYAFLISIFSGLIIFDINDVYTPQIIGWFNCEGYTYDLFVKDDYLYLADGKSGLEIYDIQKLSNPYEVGECLNSFEKRLSTIFVSNDYAFLGGYSNFLSIANITNPLEPIEIITEYYSFQIVDIFVEENLAYLSRGISGFAILDISDFSNIQTIGYNNCAPAYVVSLEKKEDLLYISNYAQGVWIFDISNISNPIKVGEINTLGIAENICIKDNYLIVQESLFLIGFEIFDISTEIPTLISQFKTHVWGVDDGDYWANDIFVQENFVYISCKEDGIKIVDITNPANPNSYFNISNIGRVETLEIMNDYIFIACGYDGFKIYTTPHKQKYAIALYLIPVIPVMIAISIIVGIRRYRKS
ncbi:MAG: hypothetical protein FK731_09310, partial [Asgard group archaeon]|nr:hypothetical protein [Asgard group archaeon]